jgi:nitroreductase
MDLIDTLRTNGAVRAFTPKPVDDGTLVAILDAARFAPSGGNRQPWRVCAVKDAATRQRLGGLMQEVWNDYVARNASGTPAFSAHSQPPAGPPPHSPNPLLDAIGDAPVVLAVAADLTRIAMMDGELGTRPPITGGASIYPFCWSILLAARAHGLGGVMTTFLSRAEPDAAPLLGLPADHALVATIFLGHPEHQNTKLRRNTVASFATIDRFDGPPLTRG